MDKINEELSANDRFNHDFYKDKYSHKESEYFGIKILNRVTKSEKNQKSFPKLHNLQKSNLNQCLFKELISN